MASQLRREKTATTVGGLSDFFSCCELDARTTAKREKKTTNQTANEKKRRENLRRSVLAQTPKSNSIFVRLSNWNCAVFAFPLVFLPFRFFLFFCVHLVWLSLQLEHCSTFALNFLFFCSLLFFIFHFILFDCRRTWKPVCTYTFVRLPFSRQTQRNIYIQSHQGREKERKKENKSTPRKFVCCRTAFFPLVCRRRRYRRFFLFRRTENENFILSNVRQWHCGKRSIFFFFFSFFFFSFLRSSNSNALNADDDNRRRRSDGWKRNILFDY